MEGAAVIRRREGDGSTVYQGDALQVLHDLPTGCVQAIVTDPPYSSGGMFRSDRTQKTGDKYVLDQGQEKFADFYGDNRDQRSFAHWCALWLAECWRVADEGAQLAVFTDWRQLPSMTDAIQAGGWIWRGIVPWNKTEATRPQKGWYRSQCEYLLVASRGKPALLDETHKADVPCLAGFFVCPVEPVADRCHQTQKPRQIVEWALQVTPKGCTVLDPFMGSGTTGEAALATGRRFIGAELSEEYFGRAFARLQGTSLVDQANLFEGIA